MANTPGGGNDARLLHCWLVHFGRVLESGLTASAQDALNGLNVGFDDLRLLTQ